MGLIVSDGKSRAQRRAEAKALKTKAKMEAKLDAKAKRKSDKIDRRAAAKSDRKATRAVTKSTKDEHKATVKAAKSAEKIAQANAKVEVAKIQAEANKHLLSTTNVKRYLAVARLIAPIAGPVIYRASVGIREQLSIAKANRAGVSPDVLRQFSGHGATLSARIATTRTSIDNLSAQDSSPESNAFTEAMRARLANLAAAVDAAEMMPTTQRRNAHLAIDRELSAIDGDILARLGVKG